MKMTITKRQQQLTCNNATGAIKLAKQSLKLRDKTLRLKNVSVVKTYSVGGLKKENRCIKVTVFADTCYVENAQFSVLVNKKNFHINYNCKTNKLTFNK